MAYKNEEIDGTMGTFKTSYREKLFYEWYWDDRPPLTQFVLKVKPEERGGISPKYDTLTRWSRDDEWEKRADELDRQAREKFETELVSAKAKMFARHADIGRGLQELGINYFDEHKITSQRTALDAIKAGVYMEQEACIFSFFSNCLDIWFLVCTGSGSCEMY